MMELHRIFLALATYSLTSEALVIPSSTNHNTTYDPEELLQKILDPITSRAAASYGLIRFEDQLSNPDDTLDQNDSGDTSTQNSGLVTFEKDTLPADFLSPEGAPVKFEDSQQDILVNDSAGTEDFHASFTSDNNNNNVGQVQGALYFENPSNQEGQKPQISSQKKKKRRRRRRRKPRLQRPPFMSLLSVPEQNVAENQGLAPNTQSPGTPGYPTGYFNRPPRTVPPTGALAAVTQALTSIARHDDLQCVPRLLCEAAGGAASGSVPSKFLQSVSGLQPLLTLLTAGNLGGSPLLVFGRAVLIGTGEGGAAACPPAFPSCPSDPERLIHYLNNHNGGFFRFFNTPQTLQDLHNQQYPQPYAPHHYGLQEDFLNQHGAYEQQDYGLLQQPSAQIPNQLTGQQNYGLLQQFHGQITDSDSYAHAGNYLTQVTGQSYGLVPGNRHFPGLQSSNGYHGFGNGNNKDNKYGLNHLNRKTNKDNGKTPGKYRIQKRIQNGRTGINQVSDIFVSPEKEDNSYKKLKFPEESILVHYLNPLSESSSYQSNRAEVGFRFPGLQSNRQYVDEKQYDSYKYNIDDYSNPVRTSSGNNAQQYSDDREQILYVVRGNGDPNHPEIVKLKPGQRLQK